MGCVPYEEIVRRRKALCVPRGYEHRYVTLTRAGLDGPWVTPLQRTSRNPDRLVLVAQDYLDTERAQQNKPAILAADGDGYCPGTKFREVLLGALEIAELRPEDVYVTQALHFLVRTWFLTDAGVWKKWESGHPAPLVNYSFERVTRYELCEHTVIAMGGVAAEACRVGGFKPAGRTSHPSRRRVKRDVLKQEIGTEIRRVLGMPSP